MKHASSERWLSLVRVLAACAVGLSLFLHLAGLAHAADPRELDARAKFAAGEYQQAVEIFARLFAESNDPIYLRNIGRCYQKLREPRKAIDSFEEYLRRGRNLSAKERREIRGYIEEMQQLSDEQAAQRPRDDQPTTTPILAPPPRAADDGPPPALLAESTPPPAPEPRPVYKRWWFWTAVAVTATGAAVGIAAAAGAFDRRADARCQPGFTCL